MDISFSLDPYNTLVVRLGGDWNIAHGLPSAEELQKKIASTPHLEKIALDARGLGEWDSSLLTFLIKLKHLCSQRSIILSCEGLPKGAERLLDLASAVPEEKDAQKKSGRTPFLSRVGEATLEAVKSDG